MIFQQVSITIYETCVTYVLSESLALNAQQSPISVGLVSKILLQSTSFGNSSQVSFLTKQCISCVCEVDICAFVYLCICVFVYLCVCVFHLSMKLTFAQEIGRVDTREAVARQA